MPSTQPDTHHGENTHTPVVLCTYVCLCVLLALPHISQRVLLALLHLHTIYHICCWVVYRTIAPSSLLSSAGADTDELMKADHIMAEWFMTPDEQSVFKAAGACHGSGL